MAIEFGAFMSGPNLVLRPDTANSGLVVRESAENLQAIKTHAGWGSLSQFKTVTGVVRTTNATATTVVSSDVVPASSCIFFRGCVAGKRDGATADGTGSFFSGAATRNGTGNLTAVAAATVTTIENSAGTPAVTISYNTTTQRVDVQVAGIASENHVWLAAIEFLIIDGTLTA